MGHSFMKNRIICGLLFLCLVLMNISLLASNSACNDDVLNELNLMYEKDQEERFKIIDSKNLGSEEAVQILEQLDQEHLPRLKAIVHQFGWPGYQLVGEEGADKMWLLVQHCDRDLEFQKLCLLLLEEAVEKKDAPKRHLAYLVDRVLVNEGNAQIYGTQFRFADGRAVPYPIEMPHDLDKRREEMGLCPFDEYLSLTIATYHLRK